jgi:hypothetical protein
MQARAECRADHPAESPPHIYRDYLQTSSIEPAQNVPPNRMNKFIHAMGVELEGAWEEEPANIHHDGSVSARGPYAGEYHTPPCVSWKELRGHVVDNYPDAINDSCGLHVHFSFTNTGLYSRLMDKEFYAYFVKLMEGFGRKHKMPPVFKKRLAGENRFCKRAWHPDIQAASRNRGDYRYCLWNFCHGLHRTAECRVLPMFQTPEQAIKAIQAVKMSVILFLRKQPLEDAGELLEMPINELVGTPELDLPAPSIQREEY